MTNGPRSAGGEQEEVEAFFDDYDGDASYGYPRHELPYFVVFDDITDDALALFLLERFQEEGDMLGAAGITSWHQPHRRAMTIVDDHREKVASFKQYDAARHGAYWGPGHVMHCLSGRQAIVSAYLHTPHNTPAKNALHFACRALAEPYARHEDYDPRWALTFDYQLDDQFDVEFDEAK